MRVRRWMTACLVLAGCAKSDLTRPAVDAGEPPPGAEAPAQWVYVNDCRAIADFFLVVEGPRDCVIAAFADRFPPAPGETAAETADVTRGPAPCPPPGDIRADYPAARMPLDVEVSHADGTFRARLTGRFPDGTPLDVDFATADRRSCCGCWGRRWPAPGP